MRPTRKDDRKRHNDRGRIERPGPKRAPKERAERAERARAEDLGNDLCWGRNPVMSLLEKQPNHCLKVVLSKTMQKGVYDSVVELCREHRIPFLAADGRSLDRMTDGANHQGVVAVMSQTELCDINEIFPELPRQPEESLALLLDHIQDPHNLGAMIRTAEACGADVVALPLRRSSLPTGTVVKTSAGASLRQTLASVGNVAAAVADFQEAGYWTVGLSQDATESIYDVKLPDRALFVVGGEGKGLSRTTAAVCDELVKIPIVGETGSLNASIALAVAVFEWRRTRQQGG